MHLRTRHDLDELAAWINPVVEGWMNYYGRFYRSRAESPAPRINTYLMRWAAEVQAAAVLQAVQGVVVRAHRSSTRAIRALAWVPRSPDFDEKSGVTGDCQKAPG